MSAADPIAMEGDALRQALIASVTTEAGKPLHDFTVAEWEAICPVKLRDMNDVRPGFFRVRRVAGGPWLPARVYLYKPRVAGTFHLAAHIAGEWADPVDVWQSGREITEPLYRELMAHPPSNPDVPVVHRRQPKDNP